MDNTIEFDITENYILIPVYEGNPVLSDLSYLDFRDPKVFWHNATKTDTFTVHKSHTIDSLTEENTGAFEIEMDIEAEIASAFNFILANEKGERTVFSFDPKKGEFGIDRSKSGIVDFTDNFTTGTIKAPLVKKKGYHIRIFVDRASVECFVNNGELVQTNRVFPTEPYNTLSFESEEEVKINSINVYLIRRN